MMVIMQVPFYVSLPVLEQVDLGRSSKAGGRLPKGWIPRSYALHLVSKKLVVSAGAGYIHTFPETLLLSPLVSADSVEGD